MNQQKPFLRIIHLSDLHFGREYDEPFSGLSSSYTHPHDRTAAESLLQTLNEIAFEEPDIQTHYVVTGDLTATGHPNEFQTVTDYLRRLPGKVSLIPGNHDIWRGCEWSFASFDPAVGVSDPYTYSAFAQAFINDAPYPSTLHINTEKGYPNVYLHGLDSSRLDKMSNAPDREKRLANVVASGNVSDDELIQLLDEINQIDQKDEDLIRILLVHYPISYESSTIDNPCKPVNGPHNYLDYPEKLGRMLNKKGWLLRNCTDVVDSVYQNRFRLVLCGHQHRGYVVPLQENRWVLSVGTATQSYRSLSKQQRDDRKNDIYTSSSAGGFHQLNNALRKVPDTTQLPSSNPASYKHTHEFRIYDFTLPSEDTIKVIIRPYCRWMTESIQNQRRPHNLFIEDTTSAPDPIIF
jgi:3',5'-cyclic AMP phosphodiesterase CpdA